MGTHIAAITETRIKTALHLEQIRILTVDIFLRMNNYLLCTDRVSGCVMFRGDSGGGG